MGTHRLSTLYLSSEPTSRGLRRPSCAGPAGCCWGLSAGTVEGHQLGEGEEGFSSCVSFPGGDSSRRGQLLSVQARPLPSGERPSEHRAPRFR